jgi:hypothetical protein
MVGADLTLLLPTAMTVAVQNASTGEVEPDSLRVGDAFPPGGVLLGRFSSAIHEVRVGFVEATATAWAGECFRIRVTLTEGGLTEADLIQLNSPLPALKVVGKEAHSTALLKVKCALKLLPAS